jgi:hypothetical protein
MAENKTLGSYSESSGIHSVATGTYNVGAGSINLDWNVSTNSGMGMSAAASEYSSAKSTMTGVHSGLTNLGTVMLNKNVGMAAANKIIADTIAGASEPAQEPSGNTGNAKDKNDKKSYGSVAATKFLKNKYIMEKYSIAPNLVSFTVEGSSEAIPYAIPEGNGIYTPQSQGTKSIKNTKNKAKNYSNAIKKLLK